MEAPALFCSGNVVQGTMLQPGNYMAQDAMGLWPASATPARQNAQNQVDHNAKRQRHDRCREQFDGDGRRPESDSGAGGQLRGVQETVPGTDLGNQLREIARFISLNATLGVGRQVFFAASARSIRTAVNPGSSRTTCSR